MPIITISGGIKSGKKELAAKLAKKLGYTAFYKEILDDCSRKYNIMEEDLLENLDELPRLWRRLSGKHRRQLIYFKCALLDAAKKDNIIYYGPYGQLFLAKLDRVLKIKIEAPFAERVKFVMEDMKKGYDSAFEYVTNHDKNRNKLVKILYDEDWHNPDNYDLIINLKNIKIDTVCSMVEHAVNSPEFQFTERSLDILQDISLESEVKAAIASDDKIWSQDVVVSVKNKEVKVTGMVQNKKLKNEIIDVVNRVKGIRSSNFKINLRSDPISLKFYKSS